MQKPWTIGVISTDYDLHDYRRAITKKLKSDGIKVSAFEMSDFPIEPDIHSHENCLVALDRIDIALVCIDKRYGGIYYDNSEKSITEEEYFAVIESKIPCLVFVSEKTWQERHAYNTELKNSGLQEEDFEKEYICKHVENAGVIQLVNKMQKIYHQKQRSNWITCYNGIPDLLEKIDGKLKGLSRYLLGMLVDEQERRLLARKTSTSGLLSLGDVFERRYYIEPSYEVKSGKLINDSCLLNDSVVDSLRNGESILVYGDAGYGKTTILAKCFLTHKHRFDQEKSYKIPFYLWLKNKGSHYHFDFEKYLEECIEEYFHKSKYPYLDITTIAPYFYLDGFDEISEKLTASEIVSIKESDIFQNPIFLTSRVQYVFRYINSCNFSDKFNICIKVNAWDEAKANEYIKNFFSLQKKSEDYINKVFDLLNKNQELRSILNSPLLVTMLLWVIESNRLNIPETITSRVDLFQECLMELAAREINRMQNPSLSANDLVSIWAVFSWLFYREKMNRSIPKVKKLLAELQEKELFPKDCEVNETLFEAIFDINHEKVYGTYHEQFLEYLTAKILCSACVTTNEPYPEFLQYVVRPEINRYFRAIWKEMEEEEKRSVITNIYSQYNEHLGDDSNEAVAKRVHAIYHISRLQMEERQKMLQRAFNIEQHISVKLSLYFGSIKMGDLDKEKEFVTMLNESDEYNNANRGYHLVYYADIIPNTSMPFSDDGETEWRGTLDAFLRHFKSNKKSHYFLRRIDLLTMLHLMKSRNKVKPLDDELIASFNKMVYNPPISQYSDFQEEIENMFVQVVEEYKRIKGNK